MHSRLSLIPLLWWTASIVGCSSAPSADYAAPSAGGSAGTTPVANAGAGQAAASTVGGTAGSNSTTMGGAGAGGSPYFPVVAGAGGQAASASGGGGSGGTGGAASSGGATGCSGVFCDSFESGTTLPAGWTIDNTVTANVVEVVSTKAHTGTNSVHMKFSAEAGQTFIVEKTGFPAPSNSLWGRVWLYVMTPTDGGHDVYIESTDAKDLKSNGVRELNTQGNMSINVDPPDNGKASSMALPRGVWTCFEWQIDATGTTGIVSLFVNGMSLVSVPDEPIPNLVEQRIGYERYGNGDVGEMWIDDYAIGTSRINCN